MKGKPNWLSWNYSKSRGPSDLLAQQAKWNKTVEWFLSAPHLEKDRQASRGYPAVELWALGLGIMMQDLLRIYNGRNEDDMKDSVMLKILRDWIPGKDKLVAELIIQTRNVLKNEYKEEARSSSTPLVANAPAPEDRSDRAATPPITEVSGSIRGRVRPEIRGSVTRSMNKKGGRASGETSHLKRHREDDLELPGRIQRTELHGYKMKRRKM